MRNIRISKLDSLFSKKVRVRDNWTCQRCGTYYEPPTQALHCAHFIGRGHKATRFDFENCVALCYGCHSHFDGAGRLEFVAFMEKRLGAERFKALVERGRSIVKFGVFEMRAKLQELKGEMPITI